MIIFNGCDLCGGAHSNEEHLAMFKDEPLDPAVLAAAERIADRYQRSKDEGREGSMNNCCTSLVVERPPMGRETGEPMSLRAGESDGAIPPCSATTQNKSVSGLDTL